MRERNEIRMDKGNTQGKGLRCSEILDGIQMRKLFEGRRDRNAIKMPTLRKADDSKADTKSCRCKEDNGGGVIQNDTGRSNTSA